MRKILVVVDMQKDFVDGALGTKEAVAIVPAVVEKIRQYDKKDIFVTRDTHQENYMDTQEGKNLPVVHCVENTEGWIIKYQWEYGTNGIFIAIPEATEPTYSFIATKESLALDYRLIIYFMRERGNQ